MNIIQESLPSQTSVMPVLKCDAYGLGINEIAKVISDTLKPNTIAVAQVFEAVELRNGGFSGNILVMGAAVNEAQILTAAEKGITLCAYGPGFFSKTASLLRKENASVKVHIKINSGLNRLGYSLNELVSEIEDIVSAKDVIAVTGIFSHFTELVGCDKNADKQYAVLTDAINLLAKSGIDSGTRHICASAGYEYYPQYSLDSVRLGRKLYYDSVENYKESEIKEPASWRASITDLRKRTKGEAIGYGGDIVLENDASIAVAGVGYGDCELLKSLTAVKAPVLIGGKRGTLLSCCMDQCFIDVTGINCSIGDEITFFGCDSSGNILPGQYVASLINDEACSLTTALGRRVKRIYE